MACTNINNAKLLMFGGRREFTSRRAELKKDRKALFQHPVSGPLKMFFNCLVKQAMDGLHEHQQRQVVDVRRPSRIHFATSRVEKGQESPFSTSC